MYIMNVLLLITILCYAFIFVINVNMIIFVSCHYEFIITYMNV